MLYHHIFKPDDVSKGYNLNDKIPFNDKGANIAAKDTRALFDVFALSARDLNVRSLLLGSLTMMLEHEVEGITDDECQEMGRILGFSNMLCRHMANWHGKMIDLMVCHERARWLAPHEAETLPDGQTWKQKLLNLPTTATELFAGGGQTLLQVSALRKSHEELTKSLSANPMNPPPPNKQTNENRGRPAMPK